ncbi:hypothetical protein BN1182_BL_00110 [Pantoea ananatis]|nr:hypothetical protein BN1182_BL_00110 [Pantoea ananatis]
MPDSLLRLCCAAWLASIPVGQTLAADFPVTIESCGQPVTFNAPPERAVINDLNMSEMAFALHLQDRIVGLTGISGWYKMTPEFKQEMGAIPELAPKYPSLETLVAVNPDFFFAGWNYGMKVGGDVTPASLSQYGIKTLVLSESCVFTQKDKHKASMDLLYHDELTLGKIFGKQAEAQALVNHWKDRLRMIPQRPSAVRPLKVFVYDSGEISHLPAENMPCQPPSLKPPAEPMRWRGWISVGAPRHGKVWRQPNLISLSCWIIKPAAGRMPFGISWKVIR